MHDKCLTGYTQISIVLQRLNKLGILRIELKAFGSIVCSLRLSSASDTESIQNFRTSRWKKLCLRWKFAANATSLEVEFDLHRVSLVSLLSQRSPQKTTLGVLIVL